MAYRIGLALLLVICTCEAASPRRGEPKLPARFPPGLYDREQTPSDDSSTEVQIGVYINHFDIDEANRLMVLDMYMRLRWVDPRLAGVVSEETRLYNGWNQVWVPDYFGRNTKSITMFDQPTPQQLMKLKPDGTIWYVHRIQMANYCPGLYHTDIRTFICPLMIESFGYVTEQMLLTWLDSPLDVDPAVHVYGFTLNDTMLYDCSQNYTAGSFPCLSMQFIFNRDSVSERPSRSTEPVINNMDCPKCQRSWNEHVIRGGERVTKKRSPVRRHPFQM